MNVGDIFTALKLPIILSAIILNLKSQLTPQNIVSSSDSRCDQTLTKTLLNTKILLNTNILMSSEDKSYKAKLKYSIIGIVHIQGEINLWTMLVEIPTRENGIFRHQLEFSVGS